MLDRSAKYLKFSVFVWGNLDKLLYPHVSKLFFLLVKQAQ